MNPMRVEKQLERELHVSWYIIAYKMILGFTELELGLAIWLWGKQIMHIYTIHVTQELSEDPHDLLAHLSETIIPHVLTHNTYLIISLLLLGAVKIAGATGLIYKKNWGVDLLVGLTIILFPFQLAHLLMHHSFFDMMYIIAGLLIAFYLVEFKPKAWISRILLRLKDAKR